MFKEIRTKAFDKMGFPFGRARREASRKIAHEKSEGLVQIEAAGDRWPIFDSSLESFTASFVGVLKGLFLSTYIEQRFEGRSIVGVELGGPGRKLFAGLNQAGVAIKRSIGVTLNNPNNAEISSSHEVMAGDLNTEETYKRLVESLDGDKADLIISRMVGGLDFLGKDPIFFAKQIAYLYKNVLSENGIMLIELPSFMESLMVDWVNLANNSGLRVIYDPIKAAILVERDDNSPEELPLLHASLLRDIYRKTKSVTFVIKLRSIAYRLARNEIVDRFIEG